MPVNEEEQLLSDVPFWSPQFWALTLLRIATLALGGVGPHTGARVLVEVQAHGALGLQGVTLDAVVEDVAHGRIGMSEETVLAGAVLAGLGFLCKRQIIFIKLGKYITK